MAACLGLSAVFPQGARGCYHRLRDLDLVPELFSRYGHIVCGVYAAIGVGGRIAVGDEADLAPAAAPAAAELEVVS